MPSFSRRRQSLRRPASFYVTGWTHIDVSALGFAGTALVVSFALYRFQLLDLVPVARETVIEEMNDGVIVLDAGRRIVDLNPAALEILDLQPSGAIGHRLEAVLPAAHVVTTSGEADGKGEPHTELEIGTGDAARWYELRTSPLRGKGRRLGGDLVVLRDVTERREADRSLAEARDQALAADRAKSEFLATMSHEVRTPMNGIIGMTDILLETELGEEQREYAERVRVAGESLLTILNDILDFSKIEAGKLEIDRRPFRFRRTVEEALDLLAERAHVRGLDLASVTAADVPDDLVGDPDRLRQILLNLLSNAVKFTDEGEVVVRATLVECDDARAIVRCEVHDTGIGIEPGARSRLFESFAQGDPSSTRRYGGTGLGLAIVKRLVDLLGGELGLESTPGAGSTFWFTMPFALAAPARDAHPVRRWPRDVRILCLSPHEATREHIRAVLTPAGAEVDLAATPDEAVSRLQRSRADGRGVRLVVADAGGSPEDARVLARTLRSHEGFATLPLIALVPFVAPIEPDAEDALVGIVAHLHKPVRRSQLLSRVQTILGLTPLEDALSA